MSDATNPRYRLVNRELNPRLATLPTWVERYRPHQIDAITRIVDAFDRVNVVVLDAPTGSGKTLIAETVRRILDTNSVYVCSSKGLQDQFARDYPYAKVLKGRGNYPTLFRAPSFHPDNYLGHISCEDCTWSMTDSCEYCPSKHKCPYEIAKHQALAANVAVLNTSYLLTEANKVGRFSGRGFVIIDEADTMEASLMNEVSVEIGERRLGRLGWSPPSRVTVEASWIEWLDSSIADLKLRISKLPTVFADVRASREARAITRLYAKLVTVRDGIPSGNWVYTGRGSNNDSSDGRGVSFRPARVDHLGSDYLWKHGTKWLLMSATVISSQEMMESLGWYGPYETVKVKNTFPVENRRVHYRGAVSMSFKNRSNGSWDELSVAINSSLREHPNHRVLVHTVSYALADYLFQRLQRDNSRPILTYHSAVEREDTLARYLASQNGVLLAPSMGRGIDLPDDACRVQMLTKVPFPYIKDRQINKRMYSQGGRLWYSVQTIRELVQMCGRAIRSETDWATTYIYDKDFETNLYARNRNLFPDWFREAIVWRERQEKSGRRV